jgi:hypothetical protein
MDIDCVSVSRHYDNYEPFLWKHYRSEWKAKRMWQKI